MCLIVLAWKRHPGYPLIIAANRDEYHARPTRTAHAWEDVEDIIAGRDMVHGGTWIGVNRRRMLAAVTNIREPSIKRPESRSRGLLVADYLGGQAGPGDYLQRVSVERGWYDPFNLLAGDDEHLVFLSTLENAIRPLEPGVYGVSNGVLDCPWPKVLRGKAALAAMIVEDRVSVESLFELLGDTDAAPDDDLPDTGVGLELERVLSPAFIRTPGYGTRASTVLLVDDAGNVTFTERSFDPAGEATGTVSLGF